MYRFHAVSFPCCSILLFVSIAKQDKENGQCAFPFGLRLTAVIFYNTIFKISVPSKNPS